MKKIGIFTLVSIIIIIIFAILFKPLIGDMIRTYRLKNTYIVFTRVNEKGVRDNDNSESEFNNYLYKSKGVTKDTKKVDLQYYGMDGKEFKIGTYLEIAYDDDRGVISWKIIEKKDIPVNIQPLLE